MTKEEQIGVIAVAAATAVVLYFVANDTLVGIVEQLLPEAVLGDYLAEPLGYAEDYTFEGAENALASAIFNTKVVDIVNDDFDFEAAYYDLLTMANILGIGDAAQAKYLANDIANVAIDGLIKIYGETHIVDEIVDNTLAIKVDDVIAYVADVLEVALAEQAAIIEDVEVLLTNVLGGTVEAPGVHTAVTVATVASNVQAVLDNFFTDEVVAQVFTEIITLYGETTVAEIVEGTLAIEFDALVDSVVRVLEKALPENAKLIADVAELLKDAIGIKLESLGFHGGEEVATLVEDIQVIVNNFTEDAIVNAVFAEVIELYGETTVRELGTVEGNFTLDAVVASVADVLVVALPENTTTVETAEELLVYVLDGTIAKPGYNANMYVSEALNIVQTIVTSVASNDIVNVVFDELEELYEGVLIVKIVEGTLDLYLDKVVEFAVDVTVAIVPEQEAIVKDVAELVTDVFGGRIAKIGFHGDLAVTELVSDVKAIVAHFTDNEIVLKVLDEIASLYGDSMINAVSETTASLPIDNVVTSIANVVELFMENTELVNAVEDLLVGIIDGTVSEAKMAEDYSAGAFIDDGQKLLGSVLELGDDINKSLDEVEELLSTVYLVSAREDINGLYLDDIVETIRVHIKHIRIYHFS